MSPQPLHPSGGTSGDQPTIAYPASTPPTGGRSGRGIWIALGISAGVLLIGGGALLAFVLTKSDPEPSVTAAQNQTETETGKVELGGRSTEDDGSGATGKRIESPDSTMASPTTAAAPTLPPPTVPSTAPPPTQPPAITARVSRTCGADGTGDCFVSLRTGPSSNGSELGRLYENDTVTIECQQRGESVKSSVLGSSTDVWARSTDGHWLAMAFLDAPGWSPTDITVSC